MICTNDPCQDVFDPRGDTHKYCSVRCRKAAEHRRNRYGQRLKSNYGITLAQFQAMSETQGGRCAICRRLPTEVGPGPFGVQRLVVDHCHSTGRIRGLLCTPCNVMLGMAQEDAEVLNEAIQYLRGDLT